MSKKKRALVLMLSLLAMVSGVAFAFEMLWFRESSLLVLTQNYSAELVDAGFGQIHTGGPVVSTWTRQPDDHHYQIAIVVTEMNQIDAGVLKVMNSTDIPGYLDVNISSVDVWTIFWDGATHTLFFEYNLATNVALNTEIAVFKNDDGDTGKSCLWDHGENPAYRRALVVTLSEYQIASSEGVSSVPLSFVVELGVSAF